MGDLPDWQTLVTPAVLQAGTFDITASTTSPIISVFSPIRIWAMWLRMSISTSAAYVAAILEQVCKMQDLSGNVLFDLACHVTAANQSQHDHIVIPVSGFTPLPLGGTWGVELVTGPTAANVFSRASAGIFYSSP